MLTVGLTGGIGAGKSTVARIFSVLGVPVFTSDDAGKRILQDDNDVRAQVIEAFGGSMYPNGMVDRKALGALVFTDASALAKLNAIVHPAVRAAFKQWALEQKAPYVINEAAVLIESGGYEQLDRLIVVTAPEEVRIARVMARDGSSSDNVKARMRNQIAQDKAVGSAQHVIVNDNATLVIPQVLAVHAQLLQRAR